MLHILLNLFAGFFSSVSVPTIVIKRHVGLVIQETNVMAVSVKVFYPLKSAAGKLKNKR